MATLLHGMKGIYMTYHQHKIDKQKKFIRDDVAGINVETIV